MYVSDPYKATARYTQEPVRQGTLWRTQKTPKINHKVQKELIMILDVFKYGIFFFMYYRFSFFAPPSSLSWQISTFYSKPELLHIFEEISATDS